MDLNVGSWFKEEWDRKAPEPGETYYVIDSVEGGLVSLRRYALFQNKPQMNTWAKIERVDEETIARRLKVPVTDAAEIARVMSAFENLPESLDPL